MKKQVPIYQLKQSYLTAFKTNAMSKAVNSLKKIDSIVDIRNVIDCLKGIFPKLPQQIEGVLYPKSPTELSDKSSTFFKPYSFVSELNWTLAYMRGHWPKLRWFAEEKIKFEHHFMLGEYTKCEQILSTINKEIGVSLWYYDAKCVLYEYQGNRTGNINFISDVLKDCKENKNYIPSLIYNLYERSSRRLSPYKFDEDLNALYKKNKTDLHEDYYKYVLYRLNYYNQYDKVDLSLPIMFESLSSLVDRYLIIISVIKSGLIINPNDEMLISKAVYLYSKTQDKTLLPIIAFKGNKIPDSYYNNSFIAALNYYYSGDYFSCKNISAQLIQQDSSLFDAYVFYCRSLIYLESEYKCIDNVDKKSPANELCEKIYNILTYKDVEDNLYSLYQMNKNLYSFEIAALMDVFIKIESNDSVSERVKYFHISHFDPIFSRLWNDKKQALNFLERYEHLSHEESIACSVWKKRILNESVGILKLPEHISGPINIEYYFNKGRYSDAFIHCETLYNSAVKYVPIRQKAVSRMIECLFLENKVQSAIKKYVEFYINDLPSVAKVDTNIIIKYLQDNLYEGIRRNMDLVIFVALTCKDTVDKSFVLFEFCELQGVCKPSELILKLDTEKYGKEKIELFFSLMNDDETLRHYLNIESFKERLTERKKILQYIVSLNTPRKESYQMMLKKVEDSLLVYNLSHNLDESKIYANDEAIINYKLTEIDGLFSRYKLLLDTVINFHKDIYIVDIRGSSFFDNQVGYEKDANTKISINSNGLYEVFYNLYVEIREQFLNSDYGLVAYLSTRVRHGELETMLRPEMAQRNLILSVRDNSYSPDKFWTETYNLGIKERVIVNNALTIFSTSFDNAVTYLIKQKLQIYDKLQKPEGLFDYQVDEKEISIKAMEIGLLLKTGNNDRVSFCQLMLKWLWEKTEINLAKVREYIDNSFMNTILQSIQTLECTIQEELPEGYVKTDILSQIRSAREIMTMKIQKISKWFTVSQPKIDDVDFRTVSHQIYNSARLSHTNCRTDSQLVIKGESFKIKSTYVIHYADIIRNIIYNMFEHGVDATDGKRHFELNIEITNSDVIINFVNDINRSPEELNKIFTQKIKDGKLLFGEGGSGIAKVNKILKRDLNNSENSISMIAEPGKCRTLVIIKLNGFKSV